MKNTVLIAFLLLGITFQLFSQEIEIKIEKEIFCRVDKSLIILTNEEGEILHDWHLTVDDFETNSILNCVLKREKYLRLDVTVYNEYSIYEHLTFDAFTEQNISKKHLIKKRHNCNFTPASFQYENIKINITGIEKVDKIALVSAQTDHNSFVKTKKSVTKIRYRLPLGSDLFITLFCNGEANPKTVFLKGNEIQPVINLDWNSLNTDVKKVSIPVINAEYWRGTITATNEDTGKRCALFRTPSSLESVIFIPEDEFFYDFLLSLRLSDDYHEKRRIYLISKGEDFLVNTLEYPKLEYESDFSDDKKTFEIKMNNDTFDLAVKYGTITPVYLPSSRNVNVVDYQIFSEWKVLNNSQDYVNYSLPNLSNYAHSYPSIELLKRICPVSLTFSNNINSNQVIKVEDVISKGSFGLY